MGTIKAVAGKKLKAGQAVVLKKNKAYPLAIPKRKLAWGGHMPKPANQQDAAVSDFCNKVAQIYGVPSMGVNAMGNQPYLNKDGRLYLLHELRKGKQAVRAIRVEFIQMSHNIDEPAVVKKTIFFKDGVEVEAVGEASKQSVKLEAVKQTLNMMAETRALNRAIWQAIAADVWNRVAENLAKSQLTEEEKQKVAEAGRVSYEEMAQPANVQATAGESPMYGATLARVMAIRGNKAKVQEALEKLPTLPLNDKEKGYIEGKLQAWLKDTK